MAPLSVTQGELLQLKDLVQSYCGIRVEESKLEFLQDRLAPVIAAQGLSSLGELCQLLLREIAFGKDLVWNTVLPLVTINETYFFRELGQLHEFRDRVVPALLGTKSSRQLRILSAPCSSGEEPYTLAMLLDEAPVSLAGWSVEILGIDIDPEAIGKARTAFYPHSAFRATEERYRAKYFAPKDGGHQVVPTLAGKARFMQANLLDLPKDRALEGFDVIFSRNMLIYFDKATQRRVVDQFHRMLNPGGYLFLGHSESLMGFDVDFKLKVASEAIYYEKPIPQGPTSTSPLSSRGTSPLRAPGTSPLAGPGSAPLPTRGSI